MSILYFASLTACDRNACTELSCKFAMCPGSGAGYKSFDDCMDEIGEAECADQQLDCAACFVDSGGDVCTELLDIAADCTETCS